MNLAMVPGPSLSKASTWQYQQQAIDAEIKSLEESLLALRHRRNKLAPISSLPTEIIAAIFYLLREQPDINLALPVAHVCHLWRQITLDHPLFWSRLDFTTVSPAGATEILARAGMVPLYLEAEVPANRWNKARFAAFQKKLRTHSSHIYRLRISAEQHHLNRTLKGLISPAPTLEHLSLSVEYYQDPWREVYVPDTLFDATTPRLSSLELYNCSISWKSPLLKSLKHFETIRCSRIVRPSLTEWLDALGEMPQLRNLLLHKASPSTSLFPFHVNRTVTLPSLARLDISDSELFCGLALAHLVLPSLTSLRLCVTVTSDPTVGVDRVVQEILRFLPYVAQHAHGPQNTEPLQRVIISHEWTRLVIHAWPMLNIDDIESDATLSERLALSITDYNVRFLNDHVTILDAVIAALPLDSLVALTAPCNTQFGFDENFWRRHVSRWPLLRHVHLAPFPALGFREMLLQDSGGRECPLLPLLTKLELIDGVLSARGTHLLYDTLMKRMEQGVPLEVLDLRSCTATGLAIRLLSEIVVDVWGPEKLENIRTDGPMDLTWDGAYSFVSDEDSEEEDNRWYPHDAEYSDD
jgi:hypothetical protein